MSDAPGCDPRPGTQVLCDVPGAGDDAIRQYWLYRPAEAAGRAPWPVLLFLHGRGEARSNQGQFQGPGAVLWHGPPPRLCQGPGWGHPFLIVSPQLPEYASRWHQRRRVEEVEAILDGVIRSHQGDEGRVYATGFSIGGLGAVAIAAQGRRRFAALLPVDAYDPEPQWEGREVTNPLAAGTPVWSHHSVRNGDAPALTRVLAANPREPTLYNLKHTEICQKAYADPEVYAWLRRQGLP
jgi:predicted peptidase